jgi:hypothetical protein
MQPLKGNVGALAARIACRLVTAVAGACLILTATAAIADSHHDDESRLDVDPPLVNFGQQAVDSASAARPVKLTNHSRRAFTVMGFRIVGAFGES